MRKQTERSALPNPGESPRRRFMIAGEHIVLRALEVEDLERCYRWMNDATIVSTLKTRYPIPFQEEAQWFESALQSSADRHFAIERRDDRTHIGNASIHEIDWVSRTAMFGLFIGDPSAWNRGFGSDAIRTLSRFAFGEMNLQKLSIRVFEYNERAKHVLATLGFIEEGCLRRQFYRDGRYHDLVIFSIFREGQGEDAAAKALS